MSNSYDYILIFCIDIKEVRKVNFSVKNLIHKLCVLIPVDPVFHNAMLHNAMLHTAMLHNAMLHNAILHILEYLYKLLCLSILFVTRIFSP
mgnify:CR=1 FL=1